MSRSTPCAAASKPLYMVGYTSKHTDPSSFFPLTDPGLPAYFDLDGYNDLDLTDQFISALCVVSLIPVGVEDANSNATAAVVYNLGQGRYIVNGLPPTSGPGRVIDAMGRMIAAVPFANHNTLQLNLGHLALGRYTLVLEGMAPIALPLIE
ncbi:MAG: hypothetical protein IPP33_09395 [Flavobacteriales bacterium]|nr:hypothetical protein [Flavobacteriales bacterium]